MTNTNYIHDIFIIDRSGSMSGILAGMQSGFQELVHDQQHTAAVAGVQVTASLWQFDTEIECLHSLAPLEDLTEYQLIPRGGTALYDAIGQAVISEGEKLAALDEDARPGTVNVTVVSDGLENRSKEYTGPKVLELLQHQQDAYKWGVLYMGTNQDALAEGEKMGVGNDQSLTYESTNTGAKKAWKASSASMSRVTRAAAAGQSITFGYTDAERKLAADGK